MRAVRASVVDEEHELPAHALPLASLGLRYAEKDPLERLAPRTLDRHRPGRGDCRPLVPAVQAPRIPGPMRPARIERNDVSRHSA